MDFKLDRSAFNAGKLINKKPDKNYWLALPVNERLRAAIFLQSINYNFSTHQLPSMDKAYFLMRKRG